VPPFPKPRDFRWDLDEELAALRAYPTLPDRFVPGKARNRLLLATWNVANLGVQKRREKDYALIAEIVSWFDLVALQEVNDDLGGLRRIQDRLPPRYRTLFSDAGGNDERFAFLYDSRKVDPQEEIGELTIPASDMPHIRLPDIPARFPGFDRNPMIASFKARDTVLLLADVHLYFGKGRGRGLPDDEAAKGMDRRVLEAYAVAWWAERRHGNRHAYTGNVIALGDFNLPKREAGDRVYDALTGKGLRLPEHSTKVASNIRNDKDYDQMALWPGPLEHAVEGCGVLDFDTAIFRRLWGRATPDEKTRFFAYLQYYLSDHRPLWMSLAV
jgi:endonuclease/exonuclease/phosphatase family metal-dependent hydrolase